MGQNKIVILELCGHSMLNQQLQGQFSFSCVDTLDAAIALVLEPDYKALVIDASCQSQPDFSILSSELLDDAELAALPVIMLSGSDALSDKLKAFELGCDDYMGPSTNGDEVCARISRGIFNYIANEQLKNRLDAANSAAFSAMADNSDLGVNQRFLLSVNGCDNLDQLGQLFFTSIEHYGLSCSLQMRSRYGVKNMEANGMARDLESQLLLQMKDAGRYVDFGQRSIINYGQCSLLIRNMPVLDERKYGAVKDNTFALVQGVHARIVAIDEHQRLLDEKRALQKLSADVKEVMGAIDQSYQDVMRGIVNAVEDMADSISQRIPNLALSLEQEQFFEQVTQDCVLETNRIFNDGLKVDECFNKLSEDMERAMQSFEEDEKHSEALTEQQQIEEKSDSIELF